MILKELHFTNGLIVSNRDHAVIIGRGKINATTYTTVLDIPCLETFVYLTKIDLNIDVAEKTFNVTVHNFQHGLSFDLNGTFTYSTDFFKGEQEVGIDDGLYIDGMFISFEHNITMDDFSIPFQKELRSIIEETVYEYLENGK